MIRQYVMSCCILTLAACTTLSPAERAARAEAQMEQMMTVYGPACDKLGYRREDDRWRDCVLRLSAQDDYRASQRSTTTTCFGNRGFLHCTTM